MWFSSLLRNTKRSGVAERRRTQAAARQRFTFRPQLEALEDRWIPSTLTVLNNLDSGPGSLRAEIAAANPGDTINFAPSLNGQTITLGGELLINKNLTIQGPGASQLTISGNYHLGFPYASGFRVFEVDNVTATIAGLTISNGYAAAPGNGGYGGGIWNRGGNLTVSNCTISNNHANAGGGIYNGKGPWDWGSSLTVSGCTLTGNEFLLAQGGGGGGGIFNAQGWCTVTLTASTLSGNHGPRFIANVAWYGGWYYDGGAIYNGSLLTLYGTTVTNNRGYEWGGGIYEDMHAHLSILSKSIVSNNIGGDIFLAYGVGTVTVSSDSHVGTIWR